MIPANVWTKLRHALGNYPTTAHDWAIRARSQDVTRRELLALDDWLRADPRNAEAYARVAKVAHLGLLLRDLPEPRARLRRMPAPVVVARSPSWRLAAGAALAALAVIGLIALQPVSTSVERYASGRGEQRQVSLPDGSHLAVNTDSEVAVAFTDAEREIKLVRGEAFFDVAKDAKRPFVVRTADAEVRAIGTRFSVRYEDGATRVVVTEGRIKFASRDASVEVASGGSAVAANKSPVLVAAVDAARATAWTSGNLEFEDAPLADVLADVNRYIRKPFVIDDPSLRQIRLTGRFRVGDVESVKFVLAGRFDLDAVEDSSAIRLSRQP